MYKSNLAILLLSLFAMVCVAQNAKVITPDLPKLVKEKKVTTFNRDVAVSADAKYQNGIHLDAKENLGVAWLNDVHFANGVLEFDVKGKNVMQQSFVGIAFHAVNDKTMDAVYFRPFNFQSPDPDRKSHSVQYISLPSYDWPKLRADFPNKYESALKQAPQPDEWFHVRIVVESPKISVYVNNNPVPDLVVEKLSTVKEGNLGFWVGNASDGDFANLKITMQ
jgi:hypothetical protein